MTAVSNVCQASTSCLERMTALAVESLRFLADETELLARLQCRTIQARRLNVTAVA